MLVDTHCHLNMIIKETFDVPLRENEFPLAKNIINAALEKNVSKILNVGTSLVESINCIELAKRFPNVWATVGIHPNDLTEFWQQDIAKLKKYLANKQENKIVGIGECGMDFHYKGYNIQRQRDGFRAQIELALEYNLPLSIHTRTAPQETLQALDEYIKDGITGVIHCFSEGFDFAKQVIDWGFVLGIGGTSTYPKNELLREIIKHFSLENIILETDAPFLPIQKMRGKKNHPEYIYDIAQYIAELKNSTLDQVATQTNANVAKIFQI
jgi:TatD DNase family protein